MADNIDVEILCPACGKKMKKVYMETQGVYLDVCLDGCGGIFFDNQEFKKFDENYEDISPLKDAYQGKQYAPVDTSSTRVCPVCSIKMVKHYASAKNEVQVDECYGCGGIFLDYSELERIRAEYETEKERSADAVKSLYYSCGAELREQSQKHSQIKDNSLIRRFASSIINKMI